MFQSNVSVSNYNVIFLSNYSFLNMMQINGAFRIQNAWMWVFTINNAITTYKVLKYLHQMFLHHNFYLHVCRLYLSCQLPWLFIVVLKSLIEIIFSAGRNSIISHDVRFRHEWWVKTFVPEWKMKGRSWLFSPVLFPCFHLCGERCHL